MRTSLQSRFAVAALSLWVVPAALHATLPNGVSLRVSRETAPPDGIAQMKIALTEPRPISTGGMSFFAADLDFAGIAVMSPANDTYAVAQLSGSQVRFAAQSPTGTFGTAGDYPIFAVSLRVPQTSTVGSITPIAIGGDGLQFVSPTGTVYPAELKDGSVTVAQSLSIDDVRPGSRDLPAGSVVVISGHGFRPTTRVRFDNAKLLLARYVDPTRMFVVLGSATRMHGQRIRVENVDGAKATYFSYERTRREGRSDVSALQSAVPLFPMRLDTNARIDIPGVLTGVALQNVGSITALAVLELVSPLGQPLAVTLTAIRPSHFRVKDVSEFFGIDYGPDYAVRVWSDLPI